MAVHADHWKDNRRIQLASENTPSMKPGEPDRAAVVLLQNALIVNGFNIPSGATGNYLSETAAAVRDVEVRFGLLRDQGIAGKQVIGTLDFLLLLRSLPGGPPAAPPVEPLMMGSPLALKDVPLARQKLFAALQSLLAVQFTPAIVPTPGGSLLQVDPLTAEALRIHFRLVVSGPTGLGQRVLSFRDIQTIIATYDRIDGVLTNPNMFRTAIPVNGLGIPAEAPLGGPITFGPAYKNFDTPGMQRIGPNSRAAILIHEATHVVDAVSGRADIHISEFDPRYDTQPADLSLHNPSSYAAFAAHIFLRRDPIPRFGLGAARTQ